MAKAMEKSAEVTMSEHGWRCLACTISLHNFAAHYSASAVNPD